MHSLSIIAEISTILDALALASTLLMILFLIQNRRKYGGMLLNTTRNEKGRVFTDEVSLQMISQQSQKTYENLQRSLTREFETLRLLGEKSFPGITEKQTGTTNVGMNHSASKMGHVSRNRRYRMANEMIAKGAGVNQILQHCGLAEGELELLQGLHQLEQNAKS